MKKLLYIMAACMACVVSHAQTTFVSQQSSIIVTTNNFFDLNPDRDALTATAGSIRIRHTVTDGIAPYDVAAGLPIQLRVVSQADGYTNAIINTITNDGVGVIWWVINSIGSGSYRLQSTVTLPGDSFPIYDRFLSVTSAPAASAATVNLTVTNVTTINYYGGSVTNL